jgi:translation initiation factor 2 subunit 3
MDSESDKEYREGEESQSEEEQEVQEEVKPKSALKKTRVILPPESKPELP